jgi:hypothetical protein
VPVTAPDQIWWNGGVLASAILIGRDRLELDDVPGLGRSIPKDLVPRPRQLRPDLAYLEARGNPRGHSGSS